MLLRVVLTRTNLEYLTLFGPKLYSVICIFVHFCTCNRAWCPAYFTITEFSGRELIVITADLYVFYVA